MAIPARAMFLLIAERKKARVNIGDTTHADSALLQTISLRSLDKSLRICQ